MADIGWITGHSYIVYGPACALGASSVVYEGLPTYPDAGRPWRIAEELEHDRICRTVTDGNPRSATRWA